MVIKPLFCRKMPIMCVTLLFSVFHDLFQIECKKEISDCDVVVQSSVLTAELNRPVWFFGDTSDLQSSQVTCCPETLGSVFSCRAVVEAVHRLDLILGNKAAYQDVFKPENISLRNK